MNSDGTLLIRYPDNKSCFHPRREAASEASASQGLSATQQQTRDRLAALRAELLACGAARLELQLKRERRKRALEDQVQELSQAMAELEEEAESMRGRAGEGRSGCTRGGDHGVWRGATSGGVQCNC